VAFTQWRYKKKSFAKKTKFPTFSCKVEIVCLTKRHQKFRIQFFAASLRYVMVLAGSITLASMCFSMYCYLYNTQTGCLRLLRELTFNKKEWKIGQVWTCWERFTYPIFYPFAFSRVRIFVHQIEFLVVSQVGYYSSFMYSWSIIHRNMNS
jgi:hypothetical protein